MPKLGSLEYLLKAGALTGLGSDIFMLYMDDVSVDAVTPIGAGKHLRLRKRRHVVRLFLRLRLLRLARRIKPVRAESMRRDPRIPKRLQKFDRIFGRQRLFGKNFAGSGGVANAVLEVMQEMGEDISDITLLACAGGDECKKALLLLKSGRLKEDFIEGMMCPGGCIGGPSKHEAETTVTKSRKTLLGRADGRKILENLKSYPMDQFSMYRDGHMD